jgi:hypothetical protein
MQSLQFLTQTPRKVKTSSIPRQVKAFDASSIRENLQSELHTSIFNEGMLPSNIYNSDIIADCWFPDKILPVVLNTKLLTVLVGLDGQPLYDLSTRQWDAWYLPPILHKVGGSQGRPRLPPEQEEKELSTLMTTVMDALIHHHNEHSFGPGTDTLSYTDPAPDIPRSPSDSDDAACTPVMFNLDGSSPTDPAHDFHHLPSNPDDAASIPAMFNLDETPFPSSGAASAPAASVMLGLRREQFVACTRSVARGHVRRKGIRLKL